MGNLVQAGAPMGPDARSWYSALFSLGTNFDSVIPFGPYLEDDQDLESLQYRVGFLDNLPLTAMVVMFTKVILVFAVLPFLLMYLTLKMFSTGQSKR